MGTQELNAELLDRRRRQLGMSRAVLAERAGVSQATVNRILGDGLGNATLRNVQAVAEALGLEFALSEAASAEDLQERQAKAKARRLVKLVQGSAALEGQGVDPDTSRQMIRQTTHELMAGSKRRLWAP